MRPSEGVDLRDLLSGEIRSVVERGASTTLMLRNAILARVVDYKGLSMRCGTHLHPLPPTGAHEVVPRIRKRLRRKRLVSADRLRPETLQRFLMAYWDDAVQDMMKRRTSAGMLRPTPRIRRNPGRHEILLDARDVSSDPALSDVLLQYKRKHYEAWLDESIPALAGKTPRQAAATQFGREKIDLLLKEVENHKAHFPETERFDFDCLRRALDIEL